MDSNYYWDDRFAINYTHAVEVFDDELGIEHYTAPRMQVCPYGDQMQMTDAQGNQLGSNGTMCLKFFDTEMEKDIQAGVGWPFDPLEKNQCIVSSYLSEKYGVIEGDKLQFNVAWTTFWNVIAIAYNQTAEAEGWPTWPFYDPNL